MTLTSMSTITENTEMKSGDIGHALKQCLQQASLSHRVTCGVFECAKLLSCNPDNVMLCILPEADNANDVTVHIQHTLIKAFCWENDIKLIKVDSAIKLATILNGSQEPKNDNIPPCTITSSDVSSLLLEFPQDTCSMEDTAVCEFFERALNSNVTSNFVIELPV
ncbi:growth arrest and DNA damage-inducible protein GADD45 alpha-like [Gigantopelta aegis]|uniref:growth arrest and DNA damage-inducible protein GADD45 alpha-like n=1 Tax=Gigantopelta aegis TaxID=1735272 RepID=UPI001B88AFAB|nr:growth arrest and DNA damage-inducible protein GADD45 alpha-like [Gigantopelta aegis]